MSIRSDLVTFLKADSSIAALVSTRVFAIVRPYDSASADCIVIRCTGSESGHDLNGAGGWDDRTFVIECRSKTLSTAESIADAVRVRCKGYSGSVGTGSTCMAMLMQNEADAYDEPEDQSFEGQYVIQQTYFFMRVEEL